MPGALKPLHAAIMSRDDAQIKALLGAGEDPDQTDETSPPLFAAGGTTSAINIAIGSGNLHALALLLEHGASVNHGEPLPPVMAAVASGDLDALKLLYVHGAWLEEAHLGEDGGTLLHMCCNLGHSSMVAWLLEQGLDREALDHYQATPLLVACMGELHAGHADAAVALLQAGAHPQHPRAGHFDPGSSSTPTQPLGLAIDSGQSRLVKALLDAGADPNAAYGVHRGFTRTPSTLAMALLNSNTSPREVEWLLQAGADLDGKVEFDFKLGHWIDHNTIQEPGMWRDGADTLNLLHVAAVSERWQEARLLCQAGFPIDGPTRLGNTALHAFLRNALREPTPDAKRMLRTLLELGADPNALDWAGATPLMLLAQRYNRLPQSERKTLAMMQMLIDAGADPGLRAGNGLTALDFVLTASEETCAGARLLQSHIDHHVLQQGTGGTMPRGPGGRRL